MVYYYFKFNFKILSINRCGACSRIYITYRDIASFYAVYRKFTRKDRRDWLLVVDKVGSDSQNFSRTITYNDSRQQFWINLLSSDIDVRQDIFDSRLRQRNNYLGIELDKQISVLFNVQVCSRVLKLFHLRPLLFTLRSSSCFSYNGLLVYHLEIKCLYTCHNLQCRALIISAGKAGFCHGLYIACTVSSSAVGREQSRDEPYFISAQRILALSCVYFHCIIVSRQFFYFRLEMLIVLKIDRVDKCIYFLKYAIRSKLCPIN